MNRAAFDYLFGDDIEADRAAEARTRPTLGHPLCEADAEARRQSLAEDAAERAERIRLRSIEIRAEQRARCRTDHARELAAIASRWRYAIGAARTDGFDAPDRDEISGLMSRTIISLRDQQEAAQGEHKGGNEG